MCAKSKNKAYKPDVGNEGFVSVTESASQLTERRSRFLAFCYPVESAADADKILLSLKKKYYDATHVCYAYIAGETTDNVSVRISDDGEPSGTAGQPILSVIRGALLSDTLVAVVRYFGGVKLGTGGLSRAYAAAALAAIGAAGRRRFVRCVSYGVTLTAADYKKVENYLAHSLCKRGETAYNESIQFLAYVAQSDADDFVNRMTALTCGRAALQYQALSFVLTEEDWSQKT